MALVRLLDLLTNPEIHNKYFDYEKDNIMLKFIKYPICKSEIVLTNEKTGFGKKQIFETEDLAWHPFVYKGKPCLVSSVTKAYLGLSGETGYYLGIKDLEAYANMYSLDTNNGFPFNTKAVPINIDIFENLKEEKLKNEKGCYWLANTYESFLDYNIFGLKYAECGYIGNDGDFLFDSDGEIYLPTNKMRIVVYLPEDISVETENVISNGSTPENGLILIGTDPYFILKGEEMALLKDYIEHCILAILEVSSKVLSEFDNKDVTKDLISHLKASIELLDRCEIKY